MRFQTCLLALFITALPGSPSARDRDVPSGTDSSKIVSETSVRFRRVRICLLAKRLKSAFDEQEKDPGLEATLADISPSNRKIRAANREIAMSADSLCNGLGTDLEDTKVYALALDAARAGDTEAAHCYVYAAFPMSAAMHDDPRQLAAYQSSSHTLIEAGVKRGDWTTIDILSSIAVGNVGVDYMDPSWRYTLSVRVPPGPAHPLTTRNPDRASLYRYNRLERMGATDELAKELDYNFDLWATWLTAETMRSEDAAAEALYTKYFSESPRRAERTLSCDI